MTARRAEQEQGRADHRRQPEIEAAVKGEEADHREAQAGETHLGLERAVGPADEARRHRAEKGMHHEVVEKAEADREQQEIREQCFHNDRRRQRLRRPQQRDARGDQPDDQEGEREVAQDEADHCLHAGTPRFPTITLDLLGCSAR
jgi:hypothetical protein